MDDDPPTRAELIAAREDLQRELERIRPNHGNFGSPPLEAKLRALIREIEESLAAMPPDDAKPEVRG